MDRKRYEDLETQTISVYDDDGIDAAIEHINNRIKENQNFVEAYIVRSQIYSIQGDFQKTLKDLEKAITLDPKEPESYFMRGMAYFKLGDRDKAFNDFNKTIELNADHAAAYSNRANMYLKMREFQKAISDCTKAIELSPADCLEAYYNRGLAYVSIDETEKAFEDYNKVIELDPENAEAYFKRGFIHSQLGNAQEAIFDFEKALEIDPNNKKAELTRKALEELRSGKSIHSDENYEVVTEKKELKILLICSAVGFVFGTITGLVNGDAFLGMWLGIGIGGAISFLPEIPGIFMGWFRKEGFIAAIKGTALGGAIWLAIFVIGGPIALLVRVIKKKRKIKKLQID